jgi:hypothetical protein
LFNITDKFNIKTVEKEKNRMHFCIIPHVKKPGKKRCTFAAILFRCILSVTIYLNLSIMNKKSKALSRRKFIGDAAAITTMGALGEQAQLFLPAAENRNM